MSGAERPVAVAEVSQGRAGWIGAGDGAGRGDRSRAFVGTAGVPIDNDDVRILRAVVVESAANGRFVVFVDRVACPTNDFGGHVVDSNGGGVRGRCATWHVERGVDECNVARRVGCAESK